MSRLGVAATNQRPDLRRYVGVCMTCHHWQVDVRAGAISDLGGWLQAMKAIGQAHADHIHGECPNAGGRVQFDGQWVEAPVMESGKAADGTLALQPLPRWWVSR